MLQQYGFQTCVLEKMTIREQIKLFARAKAVVASHGAGLTNLMFAQPETRILEIFEPTVVPCFFWSLANNMQQQYWYCLGKTVENRAYTVQPDIDLPIDKLDQSLKQLLD